MKNKKSKIVFPAITGIILILIVLFLILQFPCPTASQFFVFRLVLAIAIAGFAAVIPGFFQFNYAKVVNAGGAIAVFAFIYVINPGTIITEERCNKPFDYTIFLEDSLGKSVIKNIGTLTLKIENDKRIEAIDGKGSAVFKQIPFFLKDSSMVVQLDAEGWQFINDRSLQILI